MSRRRQNLLVTFTALVVLLTAWMAWRRWTADAAVIVRGVPVPLARYANLYIPEAGVLYAAPAKCNGQESLFVAQLSARSPRQLSAFLESRYEKHTKCWPDPAGVGFFAGKGENGWDAFLMLPDTRFGKTLVVSLRVGDPNCFTQDRQGQDNPGGDLDFIPRPPLSVRSFRWATEELDFAIYTSELSVENLARFYEQRLTEEGSPPVSLLGRTPEPRLEHAGNMMFFGHKPGPAGFVGLARSSQGKTAVICFCTR